MAKPRSKSSCEKCKNEMKTEQLRSKRVTTRRLLRSLFVNKRRPRYSLEFKLRTLPNLLKFEGNLTPWLLLQLPPEPHLLETHLTLVLLVLVVKAKTTGLK